MRLTSSKAVAERGIATKIDSARLIYFSPTQTTKRILEGIARGIRAKRLDELDLTSPGANMGETVEIHEALTIIGAPVYGGRLPQEAVLRLKRFRGDRAPAVIAVVYGNRAYEDALLELKDLVVEAGFTPVAGGAFLGEHSFSTKAVPIAPGRPDPEDLRKAAEFGAMIRDRLGSLPALNEMPPLRVPGNTPYKEWRKTSRISPVTGAACGKCGRCAGLCPTAAITIHDSVLTDPDRCLLCCACVRNCPTGARFVDDPGIKRTAEWLKVNCAGRKELEVYIA